jgi:hypothetical protein
MEDEGELVRSSEILPCNYGNPTVFPDDRVYMAIPGNRVEHDIYFES